MVEKRQFEVLLLRLVPHALRDDFMTVGLVVVEPGGKESAEHAQFADVRFTRDWKRVGCFAPDFEIEILEYLERAVREGLGEIRGRVELLRLVEQFGMAFDVAPVKALEAEDPAAEMRILERDYLAPMAEEERGRGRPRHTGRMGIVKKMEDTLADAGVLELVMRDLDMTEFTGKDDAFRVDFGYRVGRSLKMLQALALSANRDPALALAFRYSKIQDGLVKRGDEALMTAIISEEAMRMKGEVASGIALLRANEVEVRGVEEMREIAERVRLEVRG